MVETTLQKLNEVPDDKVILHPESWSSEALRPPCPSVHPRARDVRLCLLEVEVVCHCTNRHEVWDKGFVVLVPRGWHAEQESVTCLPDPFP